MKKAAIVFDRPVRVTPATKALQPMPAVYALCVLEV